MEAPNNLDICHPEQRMHIKTMRSIEKRRIIEQPKPSLDTSIGFPNTTLYRNQGTGNLKTHRLRETENEKIKEYL